MTTLTEEWESPNVSIIRQAHSLARIEVNEKAMNEHSPTDVMGTIFPSKAAADAEPDFFPPTPVNVDAENSVSDIDVDPDFSPLTIVDVDIGNKLDEKETCDVTPLTSLVTHGPSEDFTARPSFPWDTGIQGLQEGEGGQELLMVLGGSAVAVAQYTENIELTIQKLEKEGTKQHQESDNTIICDVCHGWKANVSPQWEGGLRNLPPPGGGSQPGWEFWGRHHRGNFAWCLYGGGGKYGAEDSRR